MQEIIDLIIYYARAIWLKRWYALATAWLICIIGWAVVFKLPDEYQASARVHIDTQSFLRPLLRGLAFSTSSNQQVDLMVSTLLSRPNLEKIARITDLDLTAKTDKEMDELLEELKDGIELLRVDRQDLYRITYSHEDRDVAKRVVQAVLTVFVENTLGENREDSVTARRFLDAEIKEYEQRLKDAEARLVEFKRKNVGHLSGSGNDYYQRLQAGMAEVESAKLQLVEAKRQRDSIEEQIEDQEEELSFIFDQSGTEASSIYDQRIAAIESRLDEMFLKYTDKHPDVITLKSQLEDLKLKREEDLSNRSEVVDQGNPVMQSLKLSLSQAQSMVAALEARVKSYETRVENLQKLVYTIPAIEAEMADLNRDYGVIKAKYQDLLSRREQASISQKASQASDEIEFKIVDPTRVPFEPSGPPRILFASAVLVAGMAVGIGLALLLVLIRPTFASARMLALQTGLPVLGSVGYIQFEGEENRDKNKVLVFFGLLFLLLAVFSALLLVQLLVTGQVGSTLR
ncbi:MAG: chain length-determining protein [Pseudomonadales bacterium]|nr:hypothetical protein [Pseudomonadales bacterium]MCP5214409.1 chain length-determining protein [Pseudomonadales bacterium]MCP5303301.1 chain length-determining protein [Pseudomonadales bacterium]